VDLVEEYKHIAKTLLIPSRLLALFKEVFEIIEKKSLSFEIEWIPRSRNKAGKVLG